MADPFSIVAGAISLAHICNRLGSFLRNVSEGSQRIDGDLEALSHEIASLATVNDLIKTSFESDLSGAADPAHRSTIVNLWQATEATLENCKITVEKLENLVTSIVELHTPKALSKLDGVRKYLKKQSKEEEFGQLRHKLASYRAALQIILTAVDITYTRKSQSTSNESFAQLSSTVQKLGADLESQISSLREKLGNSSERALQNALRSAKAVVPLASLNEHFSIPQAVSSIFTGRSVDLEALRSCALEDSHLDGQQTQKRFIIYGLGGSGKTQFCCKFAQDNRSRFWGVFWVDASSNEHAKQSFSRIARIGKVEPNERAAKSWLSSQERPWLLILDNADDDNVPVENYFPEGERGLILITTRNPTLKVHGTFGPRYFHFTELGEPESKDLLLRAADEPTPWTLSTLQSATEICKALGFLPLALVHAGRTILARLCTLQNYLTFFEKNWNHLRKTRSRRNSESVSDSNAIIYSSYEIMYHGLLAKNTQASQDALELFKLFSFLHRQRIRVDIFTRAASNPKLEAREQERRGQEEKKLGRKPMPKSWGQVIKGLGLGIAILLAKWGTRPVLPKVFLDATESGSFDDLRLRAALKELHQMSLIFYNPEDDSYSMHPVLHLWVRERPEMSIAEQAVWCQAAATILTQALLLPPLDDTEEEEIFRRDMLPHVAHVQSCEASIRTRFEENQISRRRPWPVLQPRFSKQQALQFAKFSLVYAQCGLWKEAEKLQLAVAKFACKMLGMEHPVTMDVMLLVARTYWELDRSEESADLQQKVLDACLKYRGNDDLKTLKVMDILGVTRWLQGNFREARRLHQEAVEGLKRVRGHDHADTLRAMGNLGRVIGKNFEFTRAVEMHKEVVSGLQKENCLGPTHLDTLIALDNLAMAYFDRAAHGCGYPGDSERAHELEVEVLEQRKAKLGKEHPYTLWSACNLARIKALRGDIDEALSIMRPGIAIAERNLGATHIGTLFGKLHLGRVLLRAKQYQEAEEMFLAVIKAHEGNRTGHGDRLLAIFSLIKCRNLQGRRHETFNLREELLERTRAIFGKGHAWETYLLDPQNLSDSSPDSWVSRRSAEERKPIVPMLRSGGNQPGIARISTL